MFTSHLDFQLKAIKYHGQNRGDQTDQIENSDIVITTYNTLSADFRNRCSVLHNISWYRVVLDEGKMIQTSDALFTITT